jgi:excinuclease ABC subunit A
MVDKLTALPTANAPLLLAPVVRGRKGEYKQGDAEWQKLGFQRVKIDGEFYAIEDAPTLDKKFKHDIDIVVDRIVTKAGLESRYADSLETALGWPTASPWPNGPTRKARRPTPHHLLRKFACPVSGFTISEIEPRLFSFNNPFGACPVCDGLGAKLAFDADMVVPDKDKTPAQGRGRPWASRPLAALHPDAAGAGAHYGFSMDKPWRKLPGKAQTVILHGSGGEKIKFVYDDNARKYETNKTFEGVLPNLERRWRETDSAWVREELGRFSPRPPARPATASA